MTQEKFEWCGYNWECCMEGGRIIHPNEPWMWFDSEMVEVEKDGTLVLNATVKPNDVVYWNGTVYHPTYAVGTIQSVETFGYGKFSCDIQMPEGTNCWPSFWITGASSWPPEIDIAEAWSNKNGSYFRLTIPQFPYIKPSWWVTNNVHYLNEDGIKKDTGSRGIPVCKMTANPQERVVRYECVWEPNKITFYANGKKIRELNDIPNVDSRMKVVFDLHGEEKDFTVVNPMKCRNFLYEKTIPF